MTTTDHTTVTAPAVPPPVSEPVSAARLAAQVDPMPWLASVLVSWQTVREALLTTPTAAARNLGYRGVSRHDGRATCDGTRVTWTLHHTDSTDGTDGADGADAVSGSATVARLVRWAVGQLTPTELARLDAISAGRGHALRTPGQARSAHEYGRQGDALMTAVYTRAAHRALDRPVQLPLWEGDL